MAKEIKYTGTLINAVTKEEIPCIIHGSWTYRSSVKNGVVKHVYMRLRRVPATSCIAAMLPDKNPDNGLLYVPPKVPKQYKHYPFLLVDLESNTKTAVNLVSCSHKAIAHYNITIRVSTDGLKFSEQVEERHEQTNA